MKMPDPLERLGTEVPVASLTRRSETLGRAAWVVSVAVPEISPNAWPWACAAVHSAKISSRNHRARRWRIETGRIGHSKKSIDQNAKEHTWCCVLMSIVFYQ